jgi:hypothetical protein
MTVDENLRPPGGNRVKRLPLRLEHRVADCICMDHRYSARLESRGGGALSRADAAREHDSYVAGFGHQVTVL